MNLECHTEGVNIKITYMVPAGHPKYRESNCGQSGKRDEEVLLIIRDPTKRWGRVGVTKERFDLSSELFDTAIQTFNMLWKKFGRDEIAEAPARQDYPTTVAEVAKLLAQKCNVS